MKSGLLVLTIAAVIAASSAQTPPPNADSLMNAFWQRIESIQRTEHEMPDLAVPIDTGASLSGLDNQMRASLETLGKTQAILVADTAVLHRHFDVVAISLCNALTRLEVLLAQQKVEYLHQHLKCCPADSSAWKDFKAAQTKLVRLARTAMLVD